MTLPLSSDLTDLALMEAVPFLPVPRNGPSPAILNLTNKEIARGFLAGKDGVFLFIKRPWITARLQISGELPLGEIYGNAGPFSIGLTCGKIPGHYLDEIVEHFQNTLPNEAGAFIIWNKETKKFRIEYPRIVEATPSRLIYNTVSTEPEESIVADIHSHGHTNPFWSVTDNNDDMHQTVLSIVVGDLNLNSQGKFIARLCAQGVYHRLRVSPFTETISIFET